MKQLEPVFADILKNAITAIERKTISLNKTEIEIIIQVIETESNQVQSLDALQPQPSEYSDTLHNLLHRLKRENRPR